jgi:CxxC-x17-CxxC domain-containing protein
MAKRTFNVKCTDCGKSTTVPFEPTKNKPVYCRTCYSKNKINNKGKSNMSILNTENAWAIYRDGWQVRKEEKNHSFFHMR